ncbi:MAG: endopeptidase La [Gemmatimonadota bacterium]|nr:endopeptidase La [Gemmatimonadota bacterium]
MPIKSTVLFPTGATGLQIGFTPNIELLTRYSARNLVVGLVYSSDDEMPIDPESLEKIGVAARVLNRLNLPGGMIQTTVQGLIRIRLEEVRLEDGVYTAYPRFVEETAADNAEAEALVERILTTLGGMGAMVPRLSEVPKILRGNLGDPGRFADLVASLAHLNVEERDGVLQRLDVLDRLKYVDSVLEAEWSRLQERETGEASPSGAAMETRDTPDAPTADRVRNLRRRIATLQAELGEVDPGERQALELLRRIDRSKLPGRVASVARQEAERLRMVPPASPEAAEIRHYVDTLLELPWLARGDYREIDLDQVREKLNEGHVGLEEVKRKILEFLSVTKLRENVLGPILCISGPPDVGKSSLVTDVAEGLGRPLVRLQLGGRGEAALMGSRRGRAGAHAGKILNAIRDTGVRDPVFLLEEIDLIGIGNVEGDPVEALEELLNPEHRSEFVDHYVDLPFDLTDTIFIATANDFFRVPRSLRELLIEIRIAGYTPEEKVSIAREHILPEMIRANGLRAEEIVVTDPTLSFLTRGYARDSGLGSLRRAIGAVLRYIAYGKAHDQQSHWEVTPALVEEILGSPRYPSTEAENRPEVGVVTGLAWTASGGELMFIEALKMPGKGRLIITGMLGDVMKESVNAAYSYVRSRAELLGIPREVFPTHDLHIHFPVGATPKDGPSAGAAVTLAMASSLSDRCVRHDIALTGEVTLRGKILEIGGVKEKILAAYRAGIREVILPVGNERDLRDVPMDVREGMVFHLVNHIDQVFRIALVGKEGTPGAGISRPEVTKEQRGMAATSRDSADAPRRVVRTTRPAPEPTGAEHTVRRRRKGADPDHIS